MDGYAVRIGDFNGTGPWRFSVGERIIAGDTRYLSIARGTAARIFTGAPVPQGADAVIMQGSVTRRGSAIEVATSPRLGLNIRREGEDATLEILKVAIRPGKPLTIGRVGGALFVGLPGNPYAAAITFLQIARPALRKAAGLLEEIDTWIPAVSGFDYQRKVGRREYLPVTWDERDAVGRPILRRLDQGSSASLGPIALAKGIAVIDPDVGQVLPGSPLQVEPLPCG